MFGVDTTELLLVAVLALLFIGPKELPTAMRTVGRWIGKIRGMARHFTSGFEDMVREAELEELERKWREENDRIMREFPAVARDVALEQDPAGEAKAYLGYEAPNQQPGEAGELPPEQRPLP